jgi:hypothetical protein
MMKLHLPAALFAMISACAAETAFQTPAVLVRKTGAPLEIQLISATKSAFSYRTSDGPKDVLEGKLPDDGEIHLLEPAGFAEALDLYQARKYAEAKAKFIAIKERFEPVIALENNPASLAGFYELECLRKTGDLEGLSAALQTFSKEPLTRETQLRQLELYVLWDAVRTKSWERLDTLAKERAGSRLPGDQRAQVAWCHGLALEGLNRPREALSAYRIAMTADAGASEEIARQAALRVLAIHKANPEVLAAMKAKDGKANADLMEAAAVARLFEMSLGAGTPLPAEFKVFLTSGGG